jgi:nucleoside-diphosphate-sugar epimerase
VLYKKKIIGLTGSTGLLGNSLKKKIRNIKNFELKVYSQDITNKFQLKKWFDENNFDYFIHLAAIVPVKKVIKNIDYAKKVNVTGTKNIINEVNNKKSLKWFFFSSTSHVYKFQNKRIYESSIIKPFSVYGKTKLDAEKYILQNINKKTKVCLGRIFSLEGKEKDKSYFLPGILNKIKKKKKFEIDLKQFRDFIHVDDVSDIIIKLMTNNKRGIFNIASGIKTNFKEIIILIEKILKRKINLKHNHYNNVKSSYASIAKISKAIKWTPKKNISYIIKDYLKGRLF